LSRATFRDSFRRTRSILVIAENDPPLVLAERLRLPRRPAALLWDMDGTVLDSLALDLGICNELLRKHLAADVHVSRAFIESIFAFEPPKFWRLILDRVEADFGMKKDAAYDAI
jgi:hypothetical protein